MSHTADVSDSKSVTFLATPVSIKRLDNEEEYKSDRVNHVKPSGHAKRVPGVHLVCAYKCGWFSYKDLFSLELRQTINKPFTYERPALWLGWHECLTRFLFQSYHFIISSETCLLDGYVHWQTGYLLCFVHREQDPQALVHTSGNERQSFASYVLDCQIHRMIAPHHVTTECWSKSDHGGSCSKEDR